MRLDDYFDRFPAVRHQSEPESDVSKRKLVRDQVINDDIAGFDQFHCLGNIRRPAVVGSEDAHFFHPEIVDWNDNFLVRSGNGKQNNHAAFVHTFPGLFQSSLGSDA